MVDGWLYIMVGAGFYWIQGWQTCGIGAESDDMTLRMVALWRLLFLVLGRGFRGRVLSLVSVYGPASGAAFDQERRRMFDCLSTLLGLLPFRSVWVVGGDFNAEVGYRGVGEDSTLGRHAHGRRTRSGHQLVEMGSGR